MDVAGRSATQSSLNSRTEIRDDVAEQVRGHDDVKTRRVIDHMHYRCVDVQSVRRYVRILARDLAQHSAPDLLRSDRVRFVDQSEMLALVARARQLECVTNHALHAEPR